LSVLRSVTYCSPKPQNPTAIIRKVRKTSGGLELLLEAFEPVFGHVWLDLGLLGSLLEPDLETAEDVLKLLRVLGVARAHVLAWLGLLHCWLLWVYLLGFLLRLLSAGLLQGVLLDSVDERVDVHLLKGVVLVFLGFLLVLGGVLLEVFRLLLLFLALLTAWVLLVFVHEVLFQLKRLVRVRLQLLNDIDLAFLRDLAVEGIEVLAEVVVGLHRFNSLLADLIDFLEARLQLLTMVSKLPHLLDHLLHSRRVNHFLAVDAVVHSVEESFLLVSFYADVSEKLEEDVLHLVRVVQEKLEEFCHALDYWHVVLAGAFIFKRSADLIVLRFVLSGNFSDQVLLLPVGDQLLVDLVHDGGNPFLELAVNLAAFARFLLVDLVDDAELLNVVLRRLAIVNVNQKRVEFVNFLLILLLLLRFLGWLRTGLTFNGRIEGFLFIIATACSVSAAASFVLLRIVEVFLVIYIVHWRVVCREVFFLIFASGSVFALHWLLGRGFWFTLIDAGRILFLLPAAHANN